MAVLKLSNTLSGAKEVFTPLDPAHVRVYACGPTVYSYAHIGNARMAVVFDLLVRVLRTLYPKVTYVSNITDVDDKIIEAARASGADIGALTEKYASIYNEDMQALGCPPPDVQPRATTHIAAMVALIEKLIAAGHAYAADGHVLFDVPSFPAYGMLSRRSRDEQVAGARVEIAPYKKDSADFVLWKPSAPDQPGWDSPWGFGRPGWHIECSAMAERHLGLPFDIHGGGADLKFPHHENEIAQSCCAHGHETDPAAFARYWVHNGFLTVEGEKMSKSLGNVTLAHDLLKAHRGEVLRLTLLSAQYRQPLDWSGRAVEQARAVLDKIYRWLESVRTVVPAPDSAPPQAVLDALCDDLNTPLALSALQAALKEDGDPARIKGQVLAAGALLGIAQEDSALWLGYGGGRAEDAAIDSLVQDRQDARAAKDFARADALRAKLDAMGVVVEDTPDGPQWRRAG